MKSMQFGLSTGLSILTSVQMELNDGSSPPVASSSSTFNDGFRMSYNEQDDALASGGSDEPIREADEQKGRADNKSGTTIDQDSAVTIARGSDELPVVRAADAEAAEKRAAVEKERGEVDGMPEGRAKEAAKAALAEHETEAQEKEEEASKLHDAVTHRGSASVGNTQVSRRSGSRLAQKSSSAEDGERCDQGDCDGLHMDGNCDEGENENGGLAHTSGADEKGLGYVADSDARGRFSSKRVCSAACPRSCSPPEDRGRVHKERD